ncbi:hypothetical protein PPYR_13555 [Photinus pyralis]|uniref:Short-chain dehydrogenase/reductase 3 n=1 Tax=Photinus pyralis TaxID=7054 RepID=A0A5N4A9D7_PHOPY|nr:short-chain dehydrogenase/reductase family 16C member 6-like [Photinus pyralis]XP_031356999.1 short-chain dehydrogenase/reductase family 16C member 6-like [Photinus pyralis]KAB0793935.1 hypothetical protein PPYR_13555 [Photinus pyralis]
MFCIIANTLCAILGSIWRYFVPNSKKSVSGEIVLITGAAQGIGREMALLYASEGATVVCVDIQEESNRKTTRMISDLGYGKAHAYTCDVSDYAKVMDMCQDVERTVGNVTILVNNAGIAFVNRLCAMSKEEIERNICVNTLSHFWMIKAILPSMLKNNYGHIVALGSISSFGGVPLLIPYSVSKYAIQGLMDSLRKELALYGNCQIKTTLVHPFFIDTEMVNRANVNYPSFLPKANKKYAATSIVNAQRSEMVEVTIPGYYLALKCLFRSIPPKLCALFYKYFKIEIQKDSSS